MPFTKYAKGGATSTFIVDQLLPRIHGKFSVGLLSMGTNDARIAWDAALFRANMQTAAASLAAMCDRVIVITVPASVEATAIIREVALEHGVIVVDGALKGVRLLRSDGVHPTALGYLTLADRAASALSAPSPFGLVFRSGQGRLGVQYVLEHYQLWVKHSTKQLIKRILGR